MTKKKYFNFYVWFYLFTNIVVILGGALVRAAGAGAGCGSHWPLCRGHLLPDLTLFETLIEFLHRISSGLVGIGAIILIVGAFKCYPKKHIVRLLSSFVLGLVILEALLGAALVLFGLVENDTSLARILVMGLHSINTFLLLGAITLTAYWSGNLEYVYKKSCLVKIFPIFLCVALLLVTGMTGAITALSDTVFKPEYVDRDFFREFWHSNHILKMLRGLHPIIAIISSSILASTIVKFGLGKGKTKSLAILVLIVICVQIFIGFFNIVFLTPISLQLIHLFLADILWITTLLYFVRVIRH